LPEIIRFPHIALSPEAIDISVRDTREAGFAF
jgi:hypothetical protein